MIPYGQSIDLWSLGIILYRLLVGYLPFVDSRSGRALDKVLRNELDLSSEELKDASEKAKSLLSLLLQKNLETRIKIRDVLRHSWLIGD